MMLPFLLVLPCMIAVPPPQPQTPNPAPPNPAQVVILLTVRFLPMPTIKSVERLLVRAVHGVPNFYQVWGGVNEGGHAVHGIPTAPDRMGDVGASGQGPIVSHSPLK